MAERVKVKVNDGQEKVSIFVQSGYQQIPTKTSQLINDGSDGTNPFISNTIIQNFTDIASLLAGQGAQIEDGVYGVADASADSALTFPSGETRLQAYYRYLGTTAGTMADYKLISAPYGNHTNTKPLVTADTGTEITLYPFGNFCNSYVANLEDTEFTFVLTNEDNPAGESATVLIKTDSGASDFPTLADAEYVEGAPFEADAYFDLYAWHNGAIVAYTFLSRSAPPVLPDLITDAVAYWSFDETGVDIINGHTAVLNAYAGYSDAVVNKGLGLVNWAQSQYADVADSTDFSFTDGVNDVPFTIRALIRFAVAKTGTRILINKRGNTDNREWELFSDGTDLIFRLWNPTGSDYIQIAHALSNYTLNEWYHLIIRYDGSKLHSGLKMNYGNTLVGTTSMSGTYTGQVNGNSIVRFGRTAYDASNGFDGLFDDVVITKGREWTDEECTLSYDKYLAAEPVITI